MKSVSPWTKYELMSRYSPASILLICTETVMYFLLGYLSKCVCGGVCVCEVSFICLHMHPLKSYKRPVIRMRERQCWRGSCLFANRRMTPELIWSNRKKKKKKRCASHALLACKHPCHLLNGTHTNIGAVDLLHISQIDTKFKLTAA